MYSLIAADSNKTTSPWVMAGTRACIGGDPARLEALRAHFEGWQRRLEGDGLDPTTATIVRLAADGLWLSSLLGLRRLERDLDTRVVATLRELTHGAPALR